MRKGIVGQGREVRKDRKKRLRDGKGKAVYIKAETAKARERRDKER